MKPFHIACAVLVTALWGGNYAVIKVGLHTFPPLLYNGLRFVLVAAMLLPFAPRPSREKLRCIALIALTLCVGHMGLIFIAMHMGLNSASGAILVQAGIPFSCLLGALFLHDRIGIWRMTGLLLSAAGTVAVMGDPNVLQYKLACAVAIASAFCWAVSNVQVKKLAGVGIVTLLAWQAVFAFPVLLVLSFVFEHAAWPQTFPPFSALAAILYTTFLSTIAAFGLWTWLIRTYEVSRIAPFALLMPFFAAACGQIFLGEHLSAALFEGGLLMALGVAVITIRRPRLQMMGSRS